MVSVTNWLSSRCIPRNYLSNEIPLAVYQGMSIISQLTFHSLCTKVQVFIWTDSQFVVYQGITYKRITCKLVLHLLCTKVLHINWLPIRSVLWYLIPTGFPLVVYQGVTFQLCSHSLCTKIWVWSLNWLSPHSLCTKVQVLQPELTLNSLYTKVLRINWHSICCVPRYKYCLSTDSPFVVCQGITHPRTFHLFCTKVQVLPTNWLSICCVPRYENYLSIDSPFVVYQIISYWLTYQSFCTGISPYIT